MSPLTAVIPFCIPSSAQADFLVQPEEAAALRSRVEMLRHDAMVRMLTERSILTEIQADRSDRVLDLTELKNENIPKKTNVLE